MKGIGAAFLVVAIGVLLLVVGGSASASPAGRTYTTSFGDMTWGSAGRATYGTDGGVIVGSLSGQVFTGQWGEDSAALVCGSSGPSGTPYWGAVVFTFNADFSAFTGDWTYCEGGSQGGWSGELKDRPTPTPTPSPTATPGPTPVPRCNGQRATISVPKDSAGRVIVGTKRADVIVGSDGNDTIRGRGGNDVICGGKGSDTIKGDKGSDDFAHGGPGIDRCAAEREQSCEQDPEIAGPRVRWQMRDRYGSPDPDGIVQPTRGINPGNYKVDFSLRQGNGKKCSARDRVMARAPGAKFSVPDSSSPCKLLGRFKHEGDTRVTFTIVTADGRGSTTETVRIQDWLIVGIGDSNGSGEGTPDIANGSAARWVNKQCHRSGNSHQALTAARIERQDPQTSVTFRHLACSGAQIDEGLLNRYTGIVPGRPLAPQVDVLGRIQKKRDVDAVVVSIGVNDLEFGAMVTFCVKWTACQTKNWVSFGNETLDEFMTRRLAELPDLYGDLAARLDEADIPANRVYITEYFDSTTDRNGNRCNPLVRVGVGPLSRDFDRAEADWAAESVLMPLNAQVRLAAATHGWNVVTGSERGFLGHGICAGNRAWIVDRADSKANQGDENGTLHATTRGNRYQRDLVVPAVLADLYDGAGNPRRP